MIVKRWINVVVVTALVTIVVAWCTIQSAITSLHMAFAEDQVSVFELNVRRAATALSHSPPDIRTARGCLRQVEEYYPSGTKQVSGSRIDRIVEDCRSLARHCILQMIANSVNAEHPEHVGSSLNKGSTGEGRESQVSGPESERGD